jgi:hypothetical protein
MKTTIFAAPAILLLAIGCSSTKEAARANREPETIVVAPIQVPGMDLPQEDARRIRSGENIRPYYVGRYIDPQDRTVMYEYNTVYRVEHEPQWNKAPRPVNTLPSGQPTRFIPDMQSQALITEFKQDMNTLEKASTILNQSAQKTAEAQKELARATKETAEARRVIDAQERKIDALGASQSSSAKTQEALRERLAELESQLADTRKAIEEAKQPVDGAAVVPEEFQQPSLWERLKIWK